MRKTISPKYIPNYIWHDVRYSMSLLTRIPVKLRIGAIKIRKTDAIWAFPIVGLMVGGLVFIAVFIANMFFPPVITSIIAVATGILVTGAIHEDGLADCADGFWGGRWPRKRLQIMKDSATGVYGVIAIALAISLKVAAIHFIITEAYAAILIPIIAASRFWMIAVMYWMKNARKAGLASLVGRPKKITVGIAAGIAVLIVLAFGLQAAMACLAGAVSTLFVIQTAQRKIRGYTGDVLGATQQCAEIASLLALVALI